MPESHEAYQSYQERMESKWKDETVSGGLFTRLESDAKAAGKTFSLEGKNKLVEKFHFGDENAIIIKRLENATVGEQNGTLGSFVEAWEYKRLKWWRDAIDAEKSPVGFLDTSIGRAAQDAGVSNWKETFNPTFAVEAFGLADQQDDQKRGERENWVRSRIMDVVGPAVLPDYELSFHDYTIRLDARSPEALKSRGEDNDTYRAMLAKVKVAAEQLAAEYENARVVPKANP